MTATASLREYLRQRAGWVWNQQEHAFKNGLSLQEETITEMLLLRMACDHKTRGLTVTMFNKSQEAINGADWEWIVMTRSCKIELRVQAKRLYHKKSKKDYGGLDTNSNQARKLIQQSGHRIPIYIFFNHDLGQNSHLLKKGNESPFRGRSYWGCSVASAQEVEQKRSNKLQDLKAIMKPWHRLISNNSTCNSNEIFGRKFSAVDRRDSPEGENLIDRIRDREFMSKYVKENELAGVAVLDFTTFRGE